MRPRRDPSAIAWLVGNELRQARVRVGETQATTAAKLGMSTSRMNYLENGRNVPRPEDVHGLMAFYGRSSEDAGRLADLLERPTRRVWWKPWAPVIAEHDRLFFGLEGFATAEFSYVPSIIPGLLHHPAYSAALIGIDQVSPLHHDRIVEFRQVRQERLRDEDNPLRLEVVIDEHALGRPVGDAAVLHEQLGHLLAVGRRSNVSIRVMPDYVAVHDGLAGPFELLDFAGMQSVGRVEYPDGAAYVDDYHAVAGYHHRRNQLRATALDETASQEVITARRAALDRTANSDDFPPATLGGAATAGPTDVGPWRTSSYSGNGSNCVEVAPWRTSSSSGNGQNCVEVAPSETGVLLRDTKDHGTGPVLTFTSAQWAQFLVETLTGEPSANGAVAVVHTATGTDVRGGDTTLHFTPGEWTAFRNGVRDQEFDTLSV